mgnify:FL=1|jgi:hypothetical protein
MRMHCYASQECSRAVNKCLGHRLSHPNAILLAKYQANPRKAYARCFSVGVDFGGLIDRLPPL